MTNDVDNQVTTPRKWRNRLVLAAVVLVVWNMVLSHHTPHAPTTPLEVPAMMELDTPTPPEVIGDVPAIAGMTP